MMTLVVVGAGGHGKVCADIASRTDRFQRIVFSDGAFARGSRLVSWVVEFHDKDLSVVDTEAFRFLVGIGQTNTGQLRQAVFERLTEYGIRSTSVVSPDASIARDAEIGEGTFVGCMGILNPNARVGINSIVNTRALLEHDAHVGNHVHISTGAILNGGVVVGDRSLVGSGAVILPGIDVCSDVVIGAGAVVTKPIDTAGTYLGCPARRTSG